METNLFRYIWVNSRREQIVVLSLVLLAMPFYFISLDVPKRIINDALQGRAFAGKSSAPLFAFDLTLPSWLGGNTIFAWGGIELEQLGYLLALSFLFLVLVVINGAFKLVINVRKGVLGEQLLRSLRADLTALMLRFRPEDARATKPSEVASMIKDEVEPIGGFAGDAFIQPFFLAMQATTALLFIFLQNVWLALVAFSVVLIQAVLIPRLRRRLLVLARARQIESRQLAGRIGAVVEAAPVIHSYGAGGYIKALVDTQLARLLDIRIALFKQKFAIKFLNNFLAQVTPFFFFAIGGYFALKGQLDLGQLVAVIGAYRDLPPPIKELIDWDQQRNDMAIKFEQVVEQFTDKQLVSIDSPLAQPTTGLAAHDLEIKALSVQDRHGKPQLQSVTTTIPFPSHVALHGEPGSGRDTFARAISRQISDVRGDIRIAREGIADLPTQALSNRIIYASQDAGLMAGSLRDNVLLALRGTPRQQTERESTTLTDQDWIDLAAADVGDAEALDRRIIEDFELVGLREDIYRFGLHGRIRVDADPATLERLLVARRRVLHRLETTGLLKRIQPFDPKSYNANATVIENLLFGLPRQRQWTDTEIGRNRKFLDVLEAGGLTDSLVAAGVKVAKTTMEMLEDLPASHPLRERYSLVAPQEMEDVRRRLEEMNSTHGRKLNRSATGGRFINVALRYSEERHRFGIIDDGFRKQIVHVRHQLREVLESEQSGAVEFFDPDRYALGAPVRDNLVFGRMGFGLPDTEQQILAIIRDVLTELDLDTTILRAGLDYDVGPSGKLLTSAQRAAVSVVRCLIRKSPVLVIEGLLAPFPPAEQQRILQLLRDRKRGTSLLATIDAHAAVDGFDRVLVFSGATLASDGVISAGAEAGAGDTRKTAAVKTSQAADDARSD